MCKINKLKLDLSSEPQCLLKSYSESEHLIKFILKRILKMLKINSYIKLYYIHFTLQTRAVNNFSHSYYINNFELSIFKSKY